MAQVNLATMDVQSLMDLRTRIDKSLVERRSQLEKQLQQIGRAIDGASIGPGRRSALKGRGVAPKYRSASGETWAGRGAKPRWLVAAIKEGKRIQDFLIEKSAQGVRGKKRRAKR